MDFEAILKNLLEKAVICFNTGDYNALNELLVENLDFYAPAYNNRIVKEPAVNFRNQKDVFAYWKRMHASYPFEITKFEYLQVGKISKFRNWMNEFGYIIDAEFHFNEYGKVTKIHNTIHGIIEI